MKKFLAVALLIASAGAIPTVTPAFADSSNDRLCGPDAPEGYKRPGGYCEQIDKKGSLMDNEGCSYRLPANLVDFKLQDGVPVLVAENCNLKKTMVTL
jgi:hypothetical protein